MAADRITVSVLTVLPVALLLAGCAPQSSRTDLPGNVSLLDDRTHTVKVLGLSEDGKTAFGRMTEEPNGRAPLSPNPPPVVFDSPGPGRLGLSFVWTRGNGFTILNGHDVEVWALSGDGLVATGTFTGADARHLFRWTRSGGVEDLGKSTGWRGPTPRTISRDGSVIMGNNYQGPFRWTRSEGLQALNIPGLLETASADGEVAYGESFQGGDNDLIPHLFRWTKAGGAEDLGTPPNGGGGKIVIGSISTSADGAVVVGSYRQENGQRRAIAFRWTRKVGLTLLPSGDGFDVRAVSADGAHIVGTLEDCRDVCAVEWSGGTLRRLGPAKLRAIVASAVSADGSVVAGMAMPDRRFHSAFVLRQ